MTELPYQEVARLVLMVLSVSESKKVHNCVPLPAEHWCGHKYTWKTVPTSPEQTVKMHLPREE